MPASLRGRGSAGRGASASCLRTQVWQQALGSEGGSERAPVAIEHREHRAVVRTDLEIPLDNVSVLKRPATTLDAADAKTLHHAAAGSSSGG